MNKENTALVVC